MTISIFLQSWAIEGKEDDLVKNDLIKIFTNNGSQVKTIELVNHKDGNGKYVNVEIENLDYEKQVVENISQITYNNLTLKPKISHDIIIKNLPECTEEYIKQECEKIGKCMRVNIKGTTNKYTYVKLDSLEVAQNLVTNLNNQIWHGNKLQVEFSQKNPNKQIGKNNLESQESIDKTPVKTELSSLKDFYKSSDYDLVTQNLKIFISEICQNLSNPPSN
ncbi:RNA recognition motif domain-containing protein [Nostoc sp. UIC 10607]|uniref:RNA recognition motif domain-containing protein n=1 Tax=Nostoc sp. UIC 10607 TaxID=3045935 RepID=UPI0039A11AEB